MGGVRAPTLYEGSVVRVKDFLSVSVCVYTSSYLGYSSVGLTC